MAGSFRDWRAWATAAAVLGEVAHELVHVVEVGAVDDEAALLAAAHQAGPSEMRKMKGERRGRQLELFADAAGGQSVVACLDEQAIDREPRLLRERGERVDCLRHFHVSRIMETT